MREARENPELSEDELNARIAERRGAPAPPPVADPVKTSMDISKKLRKRFASYADRVADAIVVAENNTAVVPVGRGIPVTVAEVLTALDKLIAEEGLQEDAELYVRLDPNVLEEVAMEIRGNRVTYLWPAVVHMDNDGDLFITVTTGDTAQIEGGATL